MQTPPPARRALADALGPPALKETLVKTDLGKRILDVLWTAAMPKGPEVLFIFEHKSWPDPKTLPQLVGYCQLLLQVYRKLHPNGPDPIIIPVVVYNGEEPWELPYAAISPRELERIFRGDNAFRYALVDLAHMSPRRMRSHAPDPQARAWLRLMGWYPAAGKWALVRIFRGLPDDGPTKELALCYTGSSKDVPVELGDWAWAKAKPHLKEEKPMTTIAEEYTAKGRVEGRTEDRAEGRAEALRRMLERRFGALPKHARAQIDAAPLAQLDAWLDAVLDADSVDAVLTNGARSAA